MALWNRYGHVALYDDTAVKNRYRMPLGVLAVVDSEYRTRIVGQSITADTTTDTFLWMLKSALESRGKQPDTFIQDADAAMTAAVREVFPDALARRNLWHLNQNVIKALAKVLGGYMKVRSTVCVGVVSLASRIVLVARRTLPTLAPLPHSRLYPLCELVRCHGSVSPTWKSDIQRLCVDRDAETTSASTETYLTTSSAHRKSSSSSSRL